MTEVPPPCDSEIFSKGIPVAALNARSQAAETWVRSIAKDADARVDWHYSGGIAQVLHLGDLESRKRVEQSITKLLPELDGNLMRRYGPVDLGQGLHRSGVTEDQAPEGAIGSFMDPFTGEAVYFVDRPDENDEY